MMGEQLAISNCRHRRCHHHLANMELDHFLTCSGLAHLEVCLPWFHLPVDSFLYYL